MRIFPAFIKTSQRNKCFKRTYWSTSKKNKNTFSQNYILLMFLATIARSCEGLYERVASYNMKVASYKYERVASYKHKELHHINT